MRSSMSAKFRASLEPLWAVICIITKWIVSYLSRPAKIEQFEHIYGLYAYIMPYSCVKLNIAGTL